MVLEERHQIDVLPSSPRRGGEVDVEGDRAISDTAERGEVGSENRTRVSAGQRLQDLHHLTDHGPSRFLLVQRTLLELSEEGVQLGHAHLVVLL